MLTFQLYALCDTAPYYAPCLPDALAYLPVFQANRSPLTLTQISELAGAFGLSANMRDVAYAAAALAETGYLVANWAACKPPAPAWHTWPATRGLAELVRCGLPNHLAAKIAPHYQTGTFACLAYEAETGWPWSSLANIRGFGRGSYQAFCRAVGAWHARQREAQP